VNQRQRLYAMLDSAEAEDIKLALGVHGRLTDSLRLLAQVLDQVGSRATTINNTLIVSSEYLTLRAALLHALSRPEFKAARIAVCEALKSIEAKQSVEDAVDAVATPVEAPVSQ
jgi:hypothetical protein